MDSDAARRLVSALAGWSRDVGWRVDGWAVARAAAVLAQLDSDALTGAGGLVADGFGRLSQLCSSP